MGKLKDLTGEQFDHLIVLHRGADKVQPSGKRIPMWTCLCDCGNIKDINGDSLRQKLTTSCGCVQRKIAKLICEERVKLNTYDLSHSYGICWTSNTNKEFYFDLEDYALIKNYTWIERKGYIYSTDGVNFHRLVMQCSDNDDIVVDHINHNALDNRKKNLRRCSQQKNSCNHKISATNTSGVTGVSYDKQRNKWIAYLTYKGEHMNLGRYDVFEDAVNARKNAEERYFREYSYDNSIKFLSNDIINEDKIVAV
jgi:hypothetical protein